MYPDTSLVCSTVKKIIIGINIKINKVIAQLDKNAMIIATPRLEIFYFEI